MSRSRRHDADKDDAPGRRSSADQHLDKSSGEAATDPAASLSLDGEPDGRQDERERGEVSPTIAELEDSLEGSEEDDSAQGDEASVSREAQLASQVERLQEQVDEQRDKWLRAMAELENFRRRSRRELESSINLARAELLKQLLDVVDNLDRALDHLRESEGGANEGYERGFRLIQEQMLKILRENGVSRIEAENHPFDPNLHDAISQIETEQVPSQHVARVVKEGYRLNDMVLRPATVIVAQ